MAGGQHSKDSDWTRRNVLGAAALTALGTLGLSACASEGRKLDLAIWRDYLGETTLEDFRKATGIEVAVTTFADNEELYAKVRSKALGFDVIVPSSMWVDRMVREELLLPLSPARLPNLVNLEPAFADLPYDPGNRHSVPYTWLALGIGYRKSKVSHPPQSWKALLQDAGSAARIALPADPALALRIAGKAQGISANGFGPAQVAAATGLLRAALPHVASFYRDGGQDLLLKREVDAAALWNGDLAQVALEDPDIAFAVPEEGALLSCDCLCIPYASRRPGNAHLLIDFLLSAAAGAGIAGRIWFPTPNAAARRLLPPEYNGNPVLYPPVRPQGKSEFVRDNPGLDAQFAAALASLRAQPR